MIFSSFEFLLIYFPAVLAVYFIIPRAHIKWRNMLLLVFSLVFYGWGEPLYVFLMIFTIIADYIFGHLIGQRKNSGKPAKALLVSAVVFNLALLGFFKYYNLVRDGLLLLGVPLPGLDIPLPVGISFYTFQALTYVVDVYRGDAAAVSSPAAFGTYITLFPQLIAGPIVRFRDIAAELTKRNVDLECFSDGVRRFVIGLAKKVMLANSSGAVWERLSASPADMSPLGAWLGIIFFTAQIYFDFSGYSDMAIGMGKMLGFRFPENFDYPYTSGSITDFWRRWHITLGSFFREYVYIPLGGNRKGALATYRNIFIVWLLTGIWHGASLNFAVWGLYYCALLIAEKLFSGKLLKKLPKAVRVLYTMFFVICGWVLFASDTLGDALTYFSRMFGSLPVTSTDIYLLIHNIPLLLILAAAATPYPKKLYNAILARFPFCRLLTPFLVASALLLSIAYLANSSYNPFLYFRF